MSYRIEYNPELKKRYPQSKKKDLKAHRIILLLLCLSVVAYAMLQSDLMEFLVPGDPAVTIPAFSEMVESVGEGESVKNAVQQFCRDVISGGR